MSAKLWCFRSRLETLSTYLRSLSSRLCGLVSSVPQLVSHVWQALFPRQSSSNHDAVSSDIAISIFVREDRFQSRSTSVSRSAPSTAENERFH